MDVERLRELFNRVLNKYYASEDSVIHERSSHISKSMEELEKEIRDLKGEFEGIAVEKERRGIKRQR